MNLINKEQAKELLRGAQKILLAPSSPLDGDSVGSSLALMSVLRKMGKEVSVVSYDKMPAVLNFLPYVSQIQSELAATRDFVISIGTGEGEVDHLKYEVANGRLNIILTPKSGKFSSKDVQFITETPDFDLIVTVDTGDLVQLGKLYELHQDLFKKTPLLNIDHHASNGKFGSHNYLEYGFAATTQMITPIILDFEKELGMELIDEDVATLLLVGIVTDTGSFQHSNTTPEAFEVAADLLDRGARQQEIIKHIYKTKSLASLKLWGRVLSKIVYEPSLRLVYSTITLQDLADTGAASDDNGGIIDELMTSAPGAEVVFLLKEKEPGYVSGSMRAPGQLADVSEIAKNMNGGGHKKAAGFRLRNMSLQEAIEEAKKQVAKHLLPKLDVNAGRLFPGLVAHPQTSIPNPSVGGEDLLLKDFRARQNTAPTPSGDFLKEASTRFFQDKDGQLRPDPQTATVEDVLDQMKQA
ncbi:DHH family phosphoesterase [Candidatus Peregrinibacteria bacterium]|nr:MAG: DHH family phosphoesterase [Candidatus Peregrinibacteria bacterium]